MKLTDKEIAEGCVLTTDGIKRYYKEGKLHKLNGPAVITTGGTWIWYHEGLEHRLDGPAAYWSSKNEYQWWYKGIRVDCSSQEEFEKLLKLKAFW